MKRRLRLKQLMSGLLALALLAFAVPIAAQAESKTIAYTPGAVKAALAKGETVLIDYKASW
jgi:hypothetical protein